MLLLLAKLVGLVFASRPSLNSFVTKFAVAKFFSEFIKFQTAKLVGSYYEQHLVQAVNFARHSLPDASGLRDRLVPGDQFSL